MVAAALIVAALEAPVLVEGDLQGREGEAQRPGLQPGCGPLPPARGSPSPWLLDAGMEFSAVGQTSGLYSGRAAALAGTTQKGPPGEEGMFVFSFYSSLSESMGLIVGFGPILSGVSITG